MPSWRTTGAGRVVLCVRAAAVAGVVCAVVIMGARADVFYLASGGSVDGKIIERTEKNYKVRTLVGTVTVPVAAVKRIERKPSVLDEYETRLEESADTPAGHVALAAWCDEHGYAAGSRRHLKRALELDPEYEPARVKLGYVRIGNAWVDGRKVAGGEAPGGRGGQANSARKNAVPPANDEKIVAAIQSQWMIRIRSIRKNKLESGSTKLIQEGRRKILAIDDPLAILPLARVLGSGSTVCRKTLVAALSHFSQDEATMNLAAIALADANPDVRRHALVELKRRGDSRVVPQFRRALMSDNDRLIQRAAIGLGELGAKAAVPELIDMLTARRNKFVEISVRSYFDAYPRTFENQTCVNFPGAGVVRHVPVIGLPSIANGTVLVDSMVQRRRVTVFRTEVMEALKKITGENYGFDHDAWRRWYEEQNP